MLLSGLIVGLGLSAEEISIPNGSFELPSTDFVSTRIDRWQEDPAPEGYSEAGGFAWDQLTGIFRNTAPGAADHLANLDGRQALYLFAIPGVGLFQDGTSRDWKDPEPLRDLQARYEPGSAYTLGAQVQGGGGGMREGVPLELSLYYRDASGRPVTVARTEVLHSNVVFADRQRLVQVSVTSPVVADSDPWARQPVGIRLRSTVAPDLAGGYWDVDAVTLRRDPQPPLRLVWSWIPGPGPRRFRLEWDSQADRIYRVESSVNGMSWNLHAGPVPGNGQRIGWDIDPAGTAVLWLRVADQPKP